MVTTEPPAGFRVPPAVERTFGWPVAYRRLRVEYEYHPGTSAAMIRAAITRLMLRRLYPAE